MDPVTMMVVGGALTGGSALARRSAQRKAFRQQEALRAQAMAADRQAMEHQREAKREAFEAKMKNPDMVIEDLSEFGVKDETAKMADLIAQARGERPVEAPPMGAPPVGTDPVAGESSFERAQRISQGRVAERAGKREAIRQALAIPGAATAGHRTALGGMGELMGMNLGQARLAQDLGRADAMPQDALSRILMQRASMVRPDVPFWAELGGAVGPMVLGAGFGGMGAPAGAGNTGWLGAAGQTPMVPNWSWLRGSNPGFTRFYG